MDKPKKKSICPLSLPDLDSNQDKLYQKQLYYPYTIRQSVPFCSEKIGMGCKNRTVPQLFQIF